MLKRSLYQKILDSLEPNKVVVLYGPRRVGKTTLLKKIATAYDSGQVVKFLDGEDKSVQDILASKTVRALEEFLKNVDLLIVDEAQKIPEIGINLKLIVDHIAGIKVIASGSASFELAKQIGEPLTGRKKTFYLFPMSLRELVDSFGMEHKEVFTKNNLMIFGGYPETFKLANDEKINYMKEIIDSYLFRDILTMENIHNPRKLRDLLVLLVFQVGKEVSISELSNNLNLNQHTVAKYLDLLEKSFVIVNIRGFSRNLRKEVSKSSRYYFYDNGIRNALINNFNNISLRDDVGALWENFIVIERLKKQMYENINSNNYFWRTYDKQEIDWVEEREGKLFGYEIKWNPKKIKKQAPSAWKQTYKDAEFECVTSENYWDFI